MATKAPLTALLIAWSKGQTDAPSELFEAVYEELRRLAAAHLRRENRGHSLAPTVLVHEAYLKLVDQQQVRWQNRAHFFALAARIMRRILVDHARARGAAKRGAGARISLADIDVAGAAPDVDLLALDAALGKLTAIDRRQTEVVELRFFGGLTVDETAEVLGVAPITVKREWALARAWLFRELQPEAR